MALAVLASAPQAHANTYWFSFTTAQLTSALSNAVGSSNMSSDAFFAIWLEAPNSVVTPTYNATQSPTSQWTTNDTWTTANSFSDASDTTFNTGGNGSDSWLQFSKQNNQADVAVVTTGANYDPNGCSTTSTAECLQYYDTGTAQPVGFGNYNSGSGGSYVTDTIGPDAAWGFTLQTSSVLSGSYTFYGVASYINNTVWGSQSLNAEGAKTNINQTFSLTLTVGVPEPGAWVLMVFGVGLMAVGSRYKKRPRQGPRS